MEANIVLQGKEISKNKSGLVSLTDIWRVSGKDKSYRPVEWLRLNATQEYIGFLEKKVGDTHLLETVKGRKGETFANWEIALEYASYLSPMLRSQINEIYARVKMADKTIATEIYENSSPENQQWIESRQKCTRARREETDVLKEHGVHTWGYGYCTNQTYKGLLGKDAKEAKKERGLKKRDNLRDNMDSDELASLYFSEVQARRKIVRDEVYGNKPCGKACFDTADKVKKLVESI